MRLGRELAVTGWATVAEVGAPPAEYRVSWSERELPVTALRRIARPDVAAAGFSRPGQTPGFELRVRLPAQGSHPLAWNLEALQVCGLAEGCAWPLIVPDYVRLEQGWAATGTLAPSQAGRDRHLVQGLRVLDAMIRPGSALDCARGWAEAWAAGRIEQERTRRAARDPSATTDPALDRLLDLPDYYLNWRVRTESALDRAAAMAEGAAGAAGPLISLLVPVCPSTRSRPRS